MVRKLELYSATHESVTVLVAKYNENPDRTKSQSDCRIRYPEKILNKKSANTFDSVGMIWIVKIK